jgi:hypothetical protein
VLTPELRDRLLYYGSRAPSPHNAQGWRIESHGPGFRVWRDPDHQVLREFDPGGRESDLACGAVVTNLCVSARAFGFDAEVRWRPGDGAAADVALAPAPAPPDEAARARLGTLRRRAMNRSPYRPDPVAGPVVDGLRAIAERHGFILSVITDRAAVGRVAALGARAGAMKLMHGPSQAELYSLMRFTPRDAARERDGLDLELFFTPALAARAAAAATHPRALGALERFGVAERLARDLDEAPLRSAPVLCLLHARSLEEETFLRGGACFEEIALDVTEAGLAMALHSAPVEVGLSHPDGPHPSVQPRALRRYRCTASGANTARIAADQDSTASSGCCNGQEWMAAAGFGLPNSLRQAVAIADIGFHSAIGCSHPGMPWMGTNAQEMNISGRKRMNPVCWAASGLRSVMPRQMPAQVNAYPNSRASANAVITSAALVCTRQPMARPTPATTTAPIIWVSSSATDRAASTAQRDMGSERNLSISPVDMSVTCATATPGAVWARPIPSIPPIRYSW